MFVFEVVSVVELGLGANTKLPIDRLQWTTDGKNSSPHTRLSLPPPPPVVASNLPFINMRTHTHTNTHTHTHTTHTHTTQLHPSHPVQLVDLCWALTLMYSYTQWRYALLK